MSRTLQLAVAGLLSGTPGYAQDMTSEIDSIFSWATPDSPGCVVGVSKDGKQVVNRAYGLADLERDIPLSPTTIFDAGSLQKQFIAAATLLLAEEGRISPSDDVREYFPELADYGQEITVDHLLTHTSGVRDWIALLRLSGGDEDALTMVLRQRALNFAPGEEWSYSNGGYLLLKELVARVSGLPFPEFARTRLFEPLGMGSTTYAADVRDVENHALAYEKEGDVWKPDMMLGVDRGPGALLTTAGDLLLWNEALTSARLGEFVTEKLQEPATLNNGRKLGYARGLFLDTSRRGKVVWHTGSAAGYKSLLSRYPEQDLSIAILCNADADRTMFAHRIFDLFVPATDAPYAAANAPVASPNSAGAKGIDVNSKAGLFFSERAGEPLRLIVQSGKLRVAGGPALVPMANDRFRNPQGTLFFMSEDEFELSFLSQDQLVLKSMEGKSTRFRRAQPYGPTAAELQAFAGRYESDELRAVFQMAPGDDGLMIRLNGSQPFEFAPVDRDTFQRGMMTLRFCRDRNGKVVALDYSNPGLRNIKFTRLSDGTSGR